MLFCMLIINDFLRLILKEKQMQKTLFSYIIHNYYIFWFWLKLSKDAVINAIKSNLFHHPFIAKK